MALALSLGRQGQGRVWPNPAVGCIIVAGGRIVGRGRTADGGRPHAEAVALAQAGPLAQGATAYVTLEPCAHHGHTPPCAEALVAAKIARIVIACTDPDPRVAGQGIAMLKSANIDVTLGVLEPEARHDHAGFFGKVAGTAPWVTLKLASSMDGRIATATGESQWITGPDARRMVHAMRARHDAVMVGAGTARADDPMLTVRDMGVTKQPVRVVVSRRLDLPTDSAMIKSTAQVPVWLCHDAALERPIVDEWQGRGAICLPCQMQGKQVDPVSVLATLAGRGLTRVFCEAGGGLSASLLGADLVDELITFGAGLVIGAEGTPAIAAMGLDRLADAPRFELIETRAVGADTMQRWRCR